MEGNVEYVKKEIEGLKLKAKYQIENLGSIVKRLEKLEKSISDIADFTTNDVMTYCQEQKERINQLEDQLKTMKSKMDECYSELTQVKAKMNESSNENMQLKRKVDEALAEMEETKAKVNTSTLNNANYYPTEDMSSKASVAGSLYDDDSKDERSLLAIKGKNWDDYNVHLNTWLERKLNVKKGARAWRIKDYGSKDTHKLVEFSKLDYRTYIWTNRQTWQDEGIWVWEQLGLTFTPVDVPGKMKAFALQHRRLGNRVVEKENYIEVNGEKWAWVGKKREILKVKDALLLDAAHECWYD